MMYLDFYNLWESPFHITPDPAFLYMSPSHQEALATIIYGVEQGKGFIALIGEVGLGKTTLMQAFMKDLAGTRNKIIYLFNSRLSYYGLLQTLARELDLEAEEYEPPALLDPIYQALIREYARGNNVILLIDEAQCMPEETLEGLRMISNLETPTEKLIQIVLVGQPELTDMLERYTLRQLKQRIAVRAVLSPLTRQESLEYIQFRCSQAGGQAESIFSRKALNKIIRQAKGIPRSINILCDNALITGCGYHRKPVSVKVVNEVIADLNGRDKPFFPRWVPVPLFAVILFFLGAWGLSVNFSPYLPRARVSAFTPTHPVSTVEKTVPDQPRPLRFQSPPLPEVVSLPMSAATAKEPHETGVQEIAPAKALESLPGPETEIPVPMENPERFPVTKIIRSGDTLDRLTREIYGASTPAIWDHVRKNNPGIREDLKIRVGEKIVFPEWQGAAVNGQNQDNQNGRFSNGYFSSF